MSMKKQRRWATHDPNFDQMPTDRLGRALWKTRERLLSAEAEVNKRRAEETVLVREVELAAFKQVQKQLAIKNMTIMDVLRHLPKLPGKAAQQAKADEA